MGKRRSPGEKRLRGFLSGDPERVARTMARCTGVADRSIPAHIRAHADAVRAAIAPLELEPELRARIEAYLAGDDAPVMPGGCVCGVLSGNPSRYGGALRRVSNQVFGGHSEMIYECVACGTRHSVTEDVGYHFPQYHWG